VVLLLQVSKSMMPPHFQKSRRPRMRWACRLCLAGRWEHSPVMTQNPCIIPTRFGSNIEMWRNVHLPDAYCSRWRDTWRATVGTVKQACVDGTVHDVAQSGGVAQLKVPQALGIWGATISSAPHQATRLTSHTMQPSQQAHRSMENAYCTIL
jgi:hypothetical protein